MSNDEQKGRGTGDDGDRQKGSSPEDTSERFTYRVSWHQRPQSFAARTARTRVTTTLLGIGELIFDKKPLTVGFERELWDSEGADGTSGSPFSLS